MARQYGGKGLEDLVNSAPIRSTNSVTAGFRSALASMEANKLAAAITKAQAAIPTNAQKYVTNPFDTGEAPAVIIDNEMLQELERQRQEKLAYAAGVAPRVQRLEDIRSLGDAANYVGGVVGATPVTMAPVIGAAVAGRVGGKMAAPLLGRASQTAARLAPTVGSGAAAYGTSYDMLADENLNAQLNDPNASARSADDRLRNARLAAMGGAVLDTALPVGLAGAARKLGMSGRNAAMGALAGAGVEGATEAAQLGLQNMQLRNLGGTTMQDSGLDYLNAGVAGAIGGGAMSGVTAGAGYAASKFAKPVAPIEQSLAEEIDAVQQPVVDRDLAMEQLMDDQVVAEWDKAQPGYAGDVKNPELGMAPPTVVTDTDVDNFDARADAAYQRASDIRRREYEELVGAAQQESQDDPVLSSLQEELTFADAEGRFDDVIDIQERIDAHLARSTKSEGRAARDEDFNNLFDAIDAIGSDRAAAKAEQDLAQEQSIVEEIAPTAVADEAAQVLTGAVEPDAERLASDPVGYEQEQTAREQLAAQTMLAELKNGSLKSGTTPSIRARVKQLEAAEQLDDASVAEIVSLYNQVVNPTKLADTVRRLKEGGTVADSQLKGDEKHSFADAKLSRNTAPLRREIEVELISSGLVNDPKQAREVAKNIMLLDTLSAQSDKEINAVQYAAMIEGREVTKRFDQSGKIAKTLAAARELEAQRIAEGKQPAASGIASAVRDTESAKNPDLFNRYPALADMDSRLDGGRWEESVMMQLMPPEARSRMLGINDNAPDNVKLDGVARPILHIATWIDTANDPAISEAQREEARGKLLSFYKDKARVDLVLNAYKDLRSAATKTDPRQIEEERSILAEEMAGNSTVAPLNNEDYKLAEERELDGAWLDNDRLDAQKDLRPVEYAGSGKHSAPFSSKAAMRETAEDREWVGLADHLERNDPNVDHKIALRDAARAVRAEANEVLSASVKNKWSSQAMKQLRVELGIPVSAKPSEGDYLARVTEALRSKYAAAREDLLRIEKARIHAASLKEGSEASETAKLLAEEDYQTQRREAVKTHGRAFLVAAHEGVVPWSDRKGDASKVLGPQIEEFSSYPSWVYRDEVMDSLDDAPADMVRSALNELKVNVAKNEDGGINLSRQEIMKLAEDTGNLRLQSVQDNRAHRMVTFHDEKTGKDVMFDTKRLAKVMIKKLDRNDQLSPKQQSWSQHTAEALLQALGSLQMIPGFENIFKGKSGKEAHDQIAGMILSDRNPEFFPDVKNITVGSLLKTKNGNFQRKSESDIRADVHADIESGVIKDPMKLGHDILLEAEVQKRLGQQRLIARSHTEALAWAQREVDDAVKKGRFKHLSEPLVPKARVPMNFADGAQGLRMRPEFAGKSTMDLIASGDRTATSRDASKAYNQYGLKEGDIIEVYASSGPSKGQNLFVRVTVAPYKLSEVSAAEWSRLEGWDESAYHKLAKNPNYEQFQYELVDIAAEQKAAIKAEVNKLAKIFNQQSMEASRPTADDAEGAFTVYEDDRPAMTHPRDREEAKRAAEEEKRLHAQKGYYNDRQRIAPQDNIQEAKGEEDLLRDELNKEKRELMSGKKPNRDLTGEAITYSIAGPKHGGWDISPATKVVRLNPVGPAFTLVTGDLINPVAPSTITKAGGRHVAPAKNVGEPAQPYKGVPVGARIKHEGTGLMGSAQSLVMLGAFEGGLVVVASTDSTGAYSDVHVLHLDAEGNYNQPLHIEQGASTVKSSGRLIPETVATPAARKAEVKPNGEAKVSAPKRQAINKRVKTFIDQTNEGLLTGQVIEDPVSLVENLVDVFTQLAQAGHLDGNRTSAAKKAAHVWVEVLDPKSAFHIGRRALAAGIITTPQYEAILEKTGHAVDKHEGHTFVGKSTPGFADDFKKAMKLMSKDKTMSEQELFEQTGWFRDARGEWRKDVNTVGEYTALGANLMQMEMNGETTRNLGTMLNGQGVGRALRTHMDKVTVSMPSTWSLDTPNTFDEAAGVIHVNPVRQILHAARRDQMFKLGDKVISYRELKLLFGRENAKGELVLASKDEVSKRFAEKFPDVGGALETALNDAAAASALEGVQRIVQQLSYAEQQVNNWTGAAIDYLGGDKEAQKLAAKIADPKATLEERGTARLALLEQVAQTVGATIYDEDGLVNTEKRDFIADIIAQQMAKDPREREIRNMLDSRFGNTYPKGSKLAEMEAALTDEQRVVRDQMIAELTRMIGTRISQQFDILEGDSEHGRGSFVEYRALDGSSVLKVLRFAASTQSGDVHVARHESVHAFFSMLKGRAKQQVWRDLRRAIVESSRVRSEIVNYYKDQKAVLDQLDPRKNPDYEEELMAYAFQLYVDGKLNLNPKSRNFFNKVVAFVANILGLATQEQRAAALFDALFAGELNPTDPEKGGYGGRNIANKMRELNKRGKPTETFRNKLERTAPGVARMADTLFATPTEVLRNSGSKALTELAEMFAPHMASARNGGLIANRGQRAAQFHNRWSKLVGRFEKAEISKALADAQAMREPTTAAGHEVREFLSDMYQYSNEAGVKRWDPKLRQYKDIVEMQNYFPRVWEHGYISQHEDEFKALIKKYSKMSDDDIDTLLREIAENDGRIEILTEKAGLDAGFTPFQASISKRGFTFINEANAHEFAKFQSQDINDIMAGYIEQAVHRAEYTRLFGNRGEVIDKLIQRAAVEDGISPEEIIQTYRYHIDALSGTLGAHSMGRGLRLAQATAITAQNIILLPFAIFSQAIDGLGSSVRTGNIRDAKNAYGQVLKDMTRFALRDKSYDYAQDVAEMLGVVSQEAAVHAVNNAGMFMMNKGLRNVNRHFFRWNGMSGWNDSMRKAAMITGIQFLEQHTGLKGGKVDERRFEELGLTLEEAKDMVVRFREGEKRGVAPEFSTAQAQAMYRFVDQAVIRPNASMRASWLSDPRWMIFAHLKQFTYGMHKVTIARAMHEADNDQMASLAILAGYAPMALAADMTKWALLGMNVTEDWGTWDYMRHAVSRGGLLGLWEFGTNVAGDAGSGRIPGSSLVGPTVEHGMTIARSLNIGVDKPVDWDRIADRSLPGYKYITSE